MQANHLVLALCAALVLAGCSDSEPAPKPPKATDPGLVDASSTTGGVRGVVVDQAIRPLKGVLVEVMDTNRTATTDETGIFVVSGLKPGPHLLRVSHIFFDTMQVAVDVQANVRDPEVVRIQLSLKTSDRPYFNTVHYKGYITCSLGADLFASEECGEGVGVPCGVPVYGCQRLLHNDNNKVQYDFYVDGPNVKTIIVEQVWKPNADATGELYTVLATNWTCDPICGGDKELAESSGPSPLYVRADEDVLKGIKIEGTTRFSTFTWPNWGGGDCQTPCANAAVNQDFDLFVTVFYAIPAPEGWSFVNGSPSPY
jgi:hypothetical protein